MCRACRGTTCVDPPTLAKPYIPEHAGPCETCGGEDPAKARECPSCRGWLKEGVVTCCPNKLIVRETRDVPVVADLAARGSWPMGRSGWMNSETASCVSAVRFWWGLEEYWKAELGID